ncbi:MAG: rRNA maturation RNase YbeY [Candidatus Cloacimonadota bacterium]|nr:MAG: rRNA maturation RNase YbeY [Candidatus Cloacimonadota bacterium]RLC52031.1 MAG: rRNA maturation RNase YbeY [Candidatus Cloacimonadota bacterium]
MHIENALNTRNKVLLENQTNLELSQEAFELVLQIVIESEALDSESFVNLLLTNDGSIQTFNKKYLGRDELTDVISFEADMPGVPLLGDIIIDTSVADKQKANRTLIEELQELFLHGLLHLLGYDHLSAAQEAIMSKKEKKYSLLLKENS